MGITIFFNRDEDQWKVTMNTTYTIISTGNGIYSFYCRKRAHLSWQCKKVNNFASSHILFPLSFSSTRLTFHFLSVNASRDAHLFLSEWWVSTSFSCIDELLMSCHVLNTIRESIIQPFKSIDSMTLNFFPFKNFAANHKQAFVCFVNFSRFIVEWTCPLI